MDFEVKENWWHPYIIGEKLYLRGIERKDLQGAFFQWANNSEVTKYMYMGMTPAYIENLEEWYNSIRQNNKDFPFLIIDKNNNQMIGTAGLYETNWFYRMAEFRIVVGEKKYWGKNYGAEATELILDYGFSKLNLHKIWLGVNAENEKAINCYVNAGFIQEGVLRDEIYRNGKYYDAIRMSILKSEHKKK